jgi:hypothetical protein
LKTAVELYEAFLIEIDRYQSPDAQVIDFLHFWNAAVYSFIENELTQFEVTNTVSDRLMMISHGKVISLNTESCNEPKKSWIVPADYFRLFGIKAQFAYARDYGFANKKGDTYTKPLKKLTADLDGFIAENRFYKPSPKNPFYQILDGKIHFVYESEFTSTNSHLYIKEFALRYVKHPVPLTLSDDFSSFNSSPFGKDVNYLILNLAVVDYMATTEDQRIQLKSKL